MIPFMTEEIYQNIVVSVDETAPESIHLCEFPTADESKIDLELEISMQRIRDIVTLGRACRNESNIKNRQPIGQMFVKADFDLSDDDKNVILDELNVKKITFTDDVRDFTSYAFKPQLKTVGPKYGKMLGQIQKALAELDGNSAMDILNAGEPLKFKSSGDSLELTDGDADVVLEKDDLLISTAEVDGYMSQSDNDITVVLDTNLTDELIEEGFVREIISKIQTMRKDADFEVMDRITVYMKDNDKIKKIVEDNIDEIKDEVLADDVIFDEVDGFTKEWKINGEECTMGVKK